VVVTSFRQTLLQNRSLAFGGGKFLVPARNKIPAPPVHSLDITLPEQSP
jgi:hypothetical protein